VNDVELIGWDRLRHGGLLLDPPRLRRVMEHSPEPLASFYERELRRLAAAILDGSGQTPDFVRFVLEEVCGFTAGNGNWQRGSEVGAQWGRRAVTGETVKPRQLWRGNNHAALPVFFEQETRLGIGRGRKAASQTVQWLRAGTERLALLTNGRQWRLIFAGLDFDAWCEWDVDLWFEEGTLSPQVHALRTLLSPTLWTPPGEDALAPLLQAILDSRKGQAELSTVLGERVREAVELLVQAHGEALKQQCADVDAADIYRAAVRVVMRMVVVLFAESRELLPRDNALYHGGYGLSGLLEQLEKPAARGGNRLARSWSAWPRVLALFRLVHQGTHHPALPVPAYGGELFAPGDPADVDGLSRALAVFENACFDQEVLPDRDLYRMLECITRTRVKVRHGRSSTWVPAPIDFSDLSSEYVGILYEGLLDFELKTAPSGDPVVFLAVGNQPALPLSRLEAMDDKALASLLEKMKDTSTGDEEAEEGEEAEPLEAEDAADEQDEGEIEDTDAPVEEIAEATEEAGPGTGDERHLTRTRAETWARRAVEVGKLARRPRGKLTPEKRLAYDEAVSRKARQLVVRVVLPGEWYLVRWGGTRKGSGTFYTRPGLAVPTVHRTLRPLAYTPPPTSDGSPDLDAPPAEWIPKTPEEILALKVCDPACGSGTFPVAALRFLTEALYASLHHHGRISADGDRAVVRLLEGAPAGAGTAEEDLGQELLPCRPDEPVFEARLKAILRRHVVERSIYGVDLDPLAVELCRLALWIETMDRTLPFSFLDHKVKCGNALVGAWFDQFQHYPVMALKNREGGDKNHGNGVHYEKDARTKVIKAFIKDTLTSDVRDRVFGQLRAFDDARLAEQAATVHDEALATLARLHELPVHDTGERARIYHEELMGLPSYGQLKDAMDLWCACWFWPTEGLDVAPLPTTLASPAEETRATARQIAAMKRFFHWELEYPDVFRAAGSGFDAILGNPPWDIAKPNSKEFFSNIDPLYRSYGKQEALRYQTTYFETAAVERDWLDYNADFRAQSNFMGHAVNPFGDPKRSQASQDRFSIARGGDNAAAHESWRSARTKSRGYADPAHPFGHQGSADLNLYKLFLEQAHALLRSGGRLGFIVPSGLYSDYGTGSLRQLFLDRCRWEWLFGFENRDRIFEIDRRFKFNPVIIEKGGATATIHTAFMRRKLEDWERAEALVTPYARAQVERFSPRSKAILEIQSQRDLEILEKIYANSVLLGDEGPDGWGIKYATEFHMTNDSKLFPPRPKWEAEGYRPDEYSRWLKGDWRPIAELWAELGVDPARPQPVEIGLDEWLFDTTADPETREARARFVHGHLLKPGDVARTEWRTRCAQPPYDTLPIPRADIPAGIILSREADLWIREDRAQDVALPLYEGRMIGQFDFSQKGWVSGKGRSAVWRAIPWTAKTTEPQFLMSKRTFAEAIGAARNLKLAFMDVSSSTNWRTMIASLIPDAPCGNKVPVLATSSIDIASELCAVLNSLTFDYQLRSRFSGLSLNYFIIEEVALPRRSIRIASIFAAAAAKRLGAAHPAFSPWWISDWMVAPAATGERRHAITGAERLRITCQIEAIVAVSFGLEYVDLHAILRGCDIPRAILPDTGGACGRNAKGFWRVDKDKDSELRHTVLTLVAFHDIEEKIRGCGGDREKGTEAFLSQNDGEGWMLPETLRLADYGLGHDERAKEHQPVASRLGPRFYDWQLTQSADESWRECQVHARNLLGEAGYRQLLTDIEAEKRGETPCRTEGASARSSRVDPQSALFK